MNPFARLKFNEVRALLKKREIKPSDIFSAYKSEAERVNPKVNAIVGERFIQAEQEFKALDSEFLTQHDFSALYAQPFTAKEMIMMKDMPQTVGLVSRKNFKAPDDAPLINKLKGVGAVPIGVTNVPELGFWYESDNLVFGLTKNPYNALRSAGGSSGGEGAIIAAQGSAFGVGSDIGGSIRIPAAFCGIAGHKPTRRLIPLTGHFPMDTKNATEFAGRRYRVTTVGPMARYVDDLIEVFKVMVGADGYDSEIQAREFSFQPLSWKGRKVFVLANPLFKMASRADETQKATVLKAAKFFQAEGAEIVELPSDVFSKAVDLWSSELGSVEGVDFNKAMGEGKAPNLLVEMLNFARLKPNHTFPVLGNALIEKYLKNPERLKSMQAELIKLRIDLNDKLGDNNILLMPPHPRVAPVHHFPKLLPFDFIYTGIFNALDFPATSVPLGLNEDLLPVGVQIAAGQFKDDISLMAALDLEKAFGGWSPSTVL